MEKRKSIHPMAFVAFLWLILTLWAWLRPADDRSAAERRQLAQFPTVSQENMLNGKFMSEFESYTLDQFPLRNNFRSLKAIVQYNVLLQQDNNGIYRSRGHLAKLEYPLDSASLDHALTVFSRIYDKYLQNSNVYACVVPDKGYYLTQGSTYPAMDYEQLFRAVEEAMPYARHIDVASVLSIDDYYRTDTHWRQECLLGAADVLCEAMGSAQPVASDYMPTESSTAFYGVYHGQAALPVAPDRLYTMESRLLSDCRVLNYETGSYGPVYDTNKAAGDDLYETFLSGSVSLLKIENPNADTEKELIIFRDSFGSAIAPLLVQGYKTVTLVDIRYISSAMLDRFIQFEGKDVLFLYSTLVLNNSKQLA